MALCEQNCSAINDGDSYVCSCRDGFILNKDKSTCRGQLLKFLSNEFDGGDDDNGCGGGGCDNDDDDDDADGCGGDDELDETNNFTDTADADGRSRSRSSDI